MKVVRCTCGVCGKEFIRPDHMKQLVCGKTCAEANVKAKARCKHCGKNIYKDGVRIVQGSSYTNYCDDACKDAYEWNLAKKEGRVTCCKECGKTFVRYRKNSQKFCSKDCYISFMKEGKMEKAPAKAKEEKIVIHEETATILCPVCGKTRPSHFPKAKYKDGIVSVPCSDKCTLELEKRKKDQESARKQQAYIEENGMCSICYVTASKCQRLKSGFRIVPKDTETNEKGRIIACPKFWTKTKF